ncbi:MAG TPA: hypothetical protein VHP55_12635 [Usitatibacter sp.]|jgi:hypothetical protein|nr:hypothetical protein [Usitatibacter sp.]HEX3097884.1 hypothetical protein [Usitatibacter sp.]
MKRFAVAAAFAFAASLPFARAADVPKPKCEPKPEYPGRLAMQSDNRRKAFERDLKNYQECINTYLAERKAAMKAEEDAANNTIADYNALMKKINDDQKAAAD